MRNSKVRLKHKGRIKQIPIYLGKMFRMFIYLNDWKVIPMAAIIAGLVSFVVGGNMFKTMEGTVMASLALSCICLWNGCFNSIQVVCRERDIVKREHRDGMHISSYIIAHMIYQAFLCIIQTIVTVMVCSLSGMAFPQQGFMFPSFYIDFGVTVFLITYAADMMALMISCIVRTTTAAMTVMPFLLIFELLFSGSMFGLPEKIEKLTDLSIAKWGINCFCAQANYNSLPMVSLWNQLIKMQDIEVPEYGNLPVQLLLNDFKNEGHAMEFCYWMGSQNQNMDYVHTYNNIIACWFSLLIFAAFFVVIAVICLEKIDDDKR